MMHGNDKTPSPTTLYNALSSQLDDDVIINDGMQVLDMLLAMTRTHVSRVITKSLNACYYKRDELLWMPFYLYAKSIA